MGKLFDTWAKRLFWGAIGMLALLGIAVNVAAFFSASPSQPAPSPEQTHQVQMQQLANQAEAQLVAHIKAQMHDPGSFEIADEAVTDRGNYVIVSMRFRGKNALGAAVLSQGVIAMSTDGKVLSLELKKLIAG